MMVDGSYIVRTATGPKTYSAADPGYVLPHEHVLLDLRVWWTGEGDWRDLDEPGQDLPTMRDAIARAPEGTARENLILSDWYVAAKELRIARENGLDLVVDLTSNGLEPTHGLALRAAKLAQVDLVVTVGRYLAAALTEEQRDLSVDQLVDEWSQQITEGINGLTPGMIGEIGTGREIEPAEETSLRAAARVQQQHGLPVNVHVHPYARTALDALRILSDEGADLSRVAISHCDGDLDAQWLKSVLQTGCYVEMDLFGTGPERLVEGRGFASDDDRIDAIIELSDAGWQDRLLLSHDICHRTDLARYGGPGYGHIGRAIRPRLVAALGESTTQKLLRLNPLTLLDVTGASF
jgi:phosphotriesterase-related protein